MAKKSLTVQFDEIQTQLEAVGMTVTRRSKHEVFSSIVFHNSTTGHSHWTGAIEVYKCRNRTTSNVRVSINGVSKWESDESPAQAFATIMRGRFGQTTIGAVFGL
jgi:hypothetical protein